MYTLKLFEFKKRVSLFWFAFSGHTKIRHQSHSAFWEPCIFGITYRIITEARWEAVTHITKAWLPLQVFHPILRQRENSTLSFGGAFFFWLCSWQTSKKSLQRALELTEVRLIQAQILELDQELQFGSHRVSSALVTTQLGFPSS